MSTKVSQAPVLIKLRYAVQHCPMKFEFHDNLASFFKRRYFKSVECFDCYFVSSYPRAHLGWNVRKVYVCGLLGRNSRHRAGES